MADLATQRTTRIAYDVVGDAGRLVVMLPGAGDLRSEYRFVGERIAAAGYRVVTADLPGHGDSPAAAEYTVASTADAIAELIGALDAGPAVVVATSFAPAAAVWLASERRDLVDGVVAISPHFLEDTSLKGRALELVTKVALRGPWAASTWAKLYTGWYKANPPDDLASEVARLRTMLADPTRRRAVRETLTASRSGVAEHMAQFAAPSLCVFGAADDHFPDPVAEAKARAADLHGDCLIVDGAGHYPHVEQPELVAKAIVAFVERLG